MTPLLRGCASDAFAASVALTLCEKAFSDNSPAPRTEAAEMKTPIIPALIAASIAALALTVVQSTASAAPGTASGPSALALAAVIAQHSPAVRASDKRVIARLFRGNTNFGFTPNTKISVDADS